MIVLGECKYWANLVGPPTLFGGIGAQQIGRYGRRHPFEICLSSGTRQKTFFLEKSSATFFLHCIH